MGMPWRCGSTRQRSLSTICPDGSRRHDAEACVNRQRLIPGLAALGILGILTLIWLATLLFRWINPPPEASNRPLIAELAYCNASDHKPCIVSFSLDLGNNTLLVNILTPADFFPDFYLKISN